MCGQIPAERERARQYLSELRAPLPNDGRDVNDPDEYTSLSTGRRSVEKVYWIEITA